MELLQALVDRLRDVNQVKERTKIRVVTDELETLVREGKGIHSGMPAWGMDERQKAESDPLFAVLGLTEH